MARKTTPSKRKTTAKRGTPPRRWPGPRVILRWLWRGALGLVAVMLLWVLAYAVINPSLTPYMLAERMRHGTLARQWVPLGDMVPALPRSVVAAEDANFCLHWGFDMAAIRAAVAEGGSRGASTLTQQTVKNAILWHGRSWPRKAAEAVLTPVAEAAWSKRRILEIYLNIAEFDRGVFGAEAAAWHYFGVPASDLSEVQAARLAAILPDPKGRDPRRPTDFLSRRAAAIRDGAATIARDGRADCFAD